MPRMVAGSRYSVTAEILTAARGEPSPGSGRRASGVAMVFPFRRRAMMVTRGMLGEPARRGGALAGLGLAGSLSFSPVRLGRDRMKERHADEMIRRRRLGLAAPPSSEVPPEPDMMDQDTAELDYRRGADMEVTLLWHRTTGELTVSVTDAASGASFELPVAADEALAAFHHPYAYAAVKGVAY